MEIISSYQLRGYDDILTEINREFEKSVKLKKEIEQVENNICFQKLNLSSCQSKICYATLKIFSSVSEIEDLYDFIRNNYDLGDVNQHKTSNFFLVEVFLVNSLLGKLTNSNWKLQITVRTECESISRVVTIDDRNSVLEVIPVGNHILECTVDVSLFYDSESEWNIIDLCSINVDISFFFETYKENLKRSSVQEDLLKITKLYNKNKSENFFDSSHQLQSQLKCSFDKNNFVSTFVKNSYHRLNLESFSEFINEPKRVIDLQFSINDEKILILYHKDTNVLKIKCCPSLMLIVKKFFLQYSTNDAQESGKKFQQIKNKRDELPYMDLEEVLTFYQQLRKIWL